MQEVLVCAIPLQEVVTHTLVVRVVIAHAVDGWDVIPAAAATREVIMSANQGA